VLGHLTVSPEGRYRPVLQFAWGAAVRRGCGYPRDRQPAPEANRIEWLWGALRRAVTHTHTRETLALLLEDADAWARTISPTAIVRQIRSPFAHPIPAMNTSSPLQPENAGSV
jgi:hypothetical protein